MNPFSSSPPSQESKHANLFDRNYNKLMINNLIFFFFFEHSKPVTLVLGNKLVITLSNTTERRASEEVTLLLQNPKVRYPVHKTSPLRPVVNDVTS